MNTAIDASPLCRTFRAGGAFGVRIVRLSPAAALACELTSLATALEAAEVVLRIPPHRPNRRVRQVLREFRRTLESSGRRLTLRHTTDRPWPGKVSLPGRVSTVTAGTVTCVTA